MRKLSDIIASLTESITFEAYNHVDEGEISGVRAACTEALRRVLPTELVETELVSLYALERILAHLSEENYPPAEFITSYAGGRPVVTCNTSDMRMAQYRGRAAARVILKHRIRECNRYDALLWQEHEGRRLMGLEHGHHAYALQTLCAAMTRIHEGGNITTTATGWRRT